MKKNLCFILMVFFILSACTPSPAGQEQAATATQEATATMIPTSTWTPEPTPTPEPSYIINTDLPALSYYDMKAQVEQVAKNFSSITFEDFTSGRLLAFEQKYIAENPIFNEEVQSKKITKGNGESFGPASGTYKSDTIVYESSGINRDNINTRPLRILSYYVLDDPEFFKSIGFDPEMYNEKKLPFWLVTWAVHNEDGTTTLGHSLMDVINYSSSLEKVKRYNKPFSLPEDDLFLPQPIYKYHDLEIKEGMMGKVTDLAPYLIYQMYPELQPDEELVDSWIKTRQMPEDLEGEIFGWYDYPSTW